MSCCTCVHDSNGGQCLIVQTPLDSLLLTQPPTPSSLAWTEWVMGDIPDTSPDTFRVEKRRGTALPVQTD